MIKLPTVYISDVTILDYMGSVQLWRVRGIDKVWYPTKIAAETCARARFPHEDSDTRYARIFYRTFQLEE